MTTSPKLVALLVFDCKKKLIYTNYDLSEISFWYRHTVQEKIESIAQSSLSTMSKNQLYQLDETINEVKMTIYGYSHDKTTIALTTPNYPQYLIRNLFLSISMDKNVDDLWFEYRDGTNTDKIQQIKTELEDTKTIIIESLEKLLERGESMDDLLAKTNNLKASSAIFADRANDLNSCCIIL